MMHTLTAAARRNLGARRMRKGKSSRADDFTGTWNMRPTVYSLGSLCLRCVRLLALKLLMVPLN